MKRKKCDVCWKKTLKVFDWTGYKAVSFLSEAIVTSIFLYFVLEFSTLTNLQCWLDLPPFYSLLNPVFCSDLNTPLLRTLLNNASATAVLNQVDRECGASSVARSFATGMLIMLALEVILIAALIVLEDRNVIQKHWLGIHIINWTFVVSIGVVGVVLWVYQDKIQTAGNSLGTFTSIIGQYCRLPVPTVILVNNFSFLFWAISGVGFIVYLGFLMYRRYAAAVGPQSSSSSATKLNP